MFGRSRRRDNDIIGPSTGLMKWVNKFFRFILFPFIHPLWFVAGIIILAIAALAVPSYYGIEFENTADWYKNKIDQHYHQAEGIINDKVVQPLMTKAETEIKKMSGSGINAKAVSKKPGKAEMVAYESPQVASRRVFQKAQEVPVDVKATLENKSAPVREEVYFKRNTSLGLTYLEQPRKTSGVAEVVNANELKIGGNLLFLYGIYAAPASEEGIAAMQYLQKGIEGKEIDCFVGAYTADGTATAICIYNGININQRLVDLNYSKDVSLN